MEREDPWGDTMSPLSRRRVLDNSGPWNIWLLPRWVIQLGIDSGGESLESEQELCEWGIGGPVSENPISGANLKNVRFSWRVSVFSLLTVLIDEYFIVNDPLRNTIDLLACRL